MVSVAAATAVVNVVGFARELAIAHDFGTSDLVDAFMLAFIVPAVARSVMGGSVSAAFMPTFVSVARTDGDDKACDLLARVAGFTLVGLALLSAALALLMPLALPALASSFSPEKRALTLRLFYLMLPVVALTGIGALWTAALNARNRFALPAMALAGMPLMAVISVLALAAHFGIYALVLGVCAGALLELSWLAFGMREEQLPLLPRLGRDALVRHVARQYFPVAAAAVMMASNILVDTAMAARLGRGSVAVLGFANRLPSVLAGAGALAVGTVVMAEFSRRAAVAEWTEMRQVARRYVGIALSVTVPVTALFFTFSEEIVQVVFQHGQFNAHDTHSVAPVQAFYLLQIPSYTAGIVGVRMLSSLDRNDALMKISAGNVMGNIVGNVVFSELFGLRGIALSTAVVYLLSMVLVLRAGVLELRRRSPVISRGRG